MQERSEERSGSSNRRGWTCSPPTPTPHTTPPLISRPARNRLINSIDQFDRHHTPHRAMSPRRGRGRGGGGGGGRGQALLPTPLLLLLLALPLLLLQAQEVTAWTTAPPPPSQWRQQQSRSHHLHRRPLVMQSLPDHDDSPCGLGFDFGTSGVRINVLESARRRVVFEAAQPWPRPEAVKVRVCVVGAVGSGWVWVGVSGWVWVGVSRWVWVVGG
jgi:hypothetical protein